MGIDSSPEVMDYFKRLAEQTGLPSQKLIDLYLLDCARKGRKLTMKWVAWRATNCSTAANASAPSEHKSRERKSV